MSDERGTLSHRLGALNDTKTELMNEGKSTDAVDDLIIKVGYAPKKKFKVVERKECSCRESR